MIVPVDRFVFHATLEFFRRWGKAKKIKIQAANKSAPFSLRRRAYVFFLQARDDELINRISNPAGLASRRGDWVLNGLERPKIEALPTENAHDRIERIRPCIPEVLARSDCLLGRNGIGPG